jgi:hypothetical protein
MKQLHNQTTFLNSVLKYICERQKEQNKFENNQYQINNTHANKQEITTELTHHCEISVCIKIQKRCVRKAFHFMQVSTTILSNVNVGYSQFDSEGFTHSSGV